MRFALAVLAAVVVVAPAPAAAPQHSGELVFPLESWHNHSSSVVLITF